MDTNTFESTFEITFETKILKNISSIQLYKILKLRSDVFVVEQSCVYSDLDNKDLHDDVIHILGTLNNNVVACARCLPPGLSYSGSSIGRVVVHPSYRGKGLAGMLMNKAITTCSENWFTHSIEIGAQLYLESFYSSLGFVTMSKPYDEDGILHIDMKLERRLSA